MPPFMYKKVTSTDTPWPHPQFSIQIHIELKDHKILMEISEFRLETEDSHKGQVNARRIRVGL